MGDLSLAQFEAKKISTPTPILPGGRETPSVAVLEPISDPWFAPRGQGLADKRLQGAKNARSKRFAFTIISITAVLRKA